MSNFSLNMFLHIQIKMSRKPIDSWRQYAYGQQFKHALDKNDLSRLRKLIDDGYDPDKGLPTSCEFGNIAAVRLMLEAKANDFDEMLIHSVRGGSLKITKLMLEHKAHDLNPALIKACEKGKLSIVKLLISNKANNLGEGFGSACWFGKINIVKYLMAFINISDQNKGLSGAFANRQPKIIRLFNTDNQLEFETYIIPHREAKRYFQTLKLYLEKRWITNNEGLRHLDNLYHKFFYGYRDKIIYNGQIPNEPPVSKKIQQNILNLAMELLKFKLDCKCLETGSRFLLIDLINKNQKKLLKLKPNAIQKIKFKRRILIKDLLGEFNRYLQY
jgi:hypothetical protein